MRILIGGVMQESNTFSPLKSGMESFHDHIWQLGQEVLQSPLENELSGFRRAVADGAADCDTEFVPTLFAQAVSGGPFAAADFAELRQIVIERLRLAGTCDAVYFAFHGAMVAEGCDDAEGQLIADIRSVVGPVIPVVISLDLHANVTRQMVDGVNGIVGYRTYPHTDFVETGQRAAEMLLSIAGETIRPSLALRKIPMIVPAENSQTSHGPFAELWREAELGMQRGNSLQTSLFPVQPWLDVTEFGSSVVVLAEGRERAEREANRLAALMWEKRYDFSMRLYPVGELIETALAEGGGNGQPFVWSDSADSPGAGAPGDSNAVLKHLLAAGVQEHLSCLLTIVDPPAVECSISAGVGERIPLRLGYALAPGRGEPLEVTGKVKKISDGLFRFKNGFVKRSEGNMGRCVVVQIGRISLLITEKAVFTGDPEMYRSVGLEPMDADIVVVKSANQFRADYDRLTSRIFILDTPGCSTSDLQSLDLRHVVRPFYPFDDDFDWSEN